MTKSNFIDAEYIARLLISNDPNTFDQLVRKYQSDVRHFLRRLTAGDYALADDLAQETFIIAFQKIATYTGKGHFKGWLLKIAYRRFLKFRQKASFKHEIVSDECVLGFSDNESVEADILAEKMMSCLTIEARALMTLHYSEGMSHSEIRDFTGLPLGSIKSTIRRSKQKLIKEFSNVEDVA